MSIRSSFTLVMSLGIILVVSMACLPRTPELPVMTEPPKGVSEPPVTTEPLSTVTPEMGETPTLESPEQPEPTMALPVKLDIIPGAVPPSDVLEQLFCFAVPPGGIYHCMSSETSEIMEEVIEMGEPVTWCACGFEQGEEFLVIVINPNGETVVVREETAFADSCQEGFLSRNTFLPDDPMGQYIIEIVGQDSTLALSFILAPASRPTILSTDTGYVLAGFNPFERVRLLGYKYLGGDYVHFVGEWWVAVDEEGILYIEVDTSVEMYAIGTESGEAPPYIGTYSLSSRWVKYEGELAYGAAVDASDQLSIRSVPSLSDDLIATIPAGTRMQIVSGPMGNNDTFWWTVMLEDGTSGWADENSLRLVDYEPNDTLETAASLFLFSPEDSQASFWASALRIDPDDEDWFALPLAAGQDVDIYVISELMELELGELGVALYSSDGRQLAGGRKMDYMLSLDLETAQSDTYYLRIYGQTGGEKDTYTIVIDIW